MPVRYFRTVEELNQPLWRAPGDPALAQAIRAVWGAGQRLSPRRFPPGVHRYRSIEELDAAVTRWRAEHVEQTARRPSG